MKQPAILLGAVLLLTAATFAQEQSNFSGMWRLNQAKSTSGIAGNSPNVVFPSQIVVKQSATEFYVSMTSVRQRPVSVVYKLDGSQINVAGPSEITETGAAKIEGQTVVIASRRSFASPAGETVVSFKEVWSVAGNVLTIEKTCIEDGETSTEKAVYDKG